MEKYAFYYPRSIFDCKRKWCERWLDQHVTSVGQKENLSSGQKSSPWPPEHRANARSFNWVRMWQVSLILLGSALLKSSWVVMVKFVITERWQKKSCPRKLPRANALPSNNAPSPGKWFCQRSCHLWKSSTYNTERRFKIIILLIRTFSIRCTGHNFQQLLS